ncbi:hypothetical protein CVT25_000797 [Psilocybe cyanescens]|uniref:Uncharacterized protein n=1 Tax=Psilocybe cyanescens TaxID=93625 RepID=A0A409XMB5_PSICY|nr:hypothetical protein CVT25_000797 [Psilocybe cyanescens]
MDGSRDEVSEVLSERERVRGRRCKRKERTGNTPVPSPSLTHTVVPKATASREWVVANILAAGNVDSIQYRVTRKAHTPRTSVAVASSVRVWIDTTSEH